MNKFKTRLRVCVALVVLASAGASAEDYLSPLALVADKAGSTMYVAEFTADQVVAFDLADGTVEKSFTLPSHPTGVALSLDESRLYVTTASPAGKVYVIELSQENRMSSISVGHTPTAPVVSPDGRTLYVCNQFNNDVSVIDLAAAKETARVAVMREPVAADITPDGKLLFVANMLPAGAADVGYTTAVVSIIDTEAKEVAAKIQLPNGSTGLRGICVSPDGRHVYVTHILGRYQLPTTQLERGWMNTNALSVIDVAEKTLINTVLIDDIDLGAANPWGVACTADGKYVCVAHAGTHEVSVIDRAQLHEKLDKAAAGEKSSDSLNAMSYPTDVPNDLAFLVGLRRRLRLSGNGPRGLVIVGTKVYTAEYFSDSLGMVDISRGVRPESLSLPLGPESSEPMDVVRRGEMLFNDARMCFQMWQSCASCHPDGSRPDGLNWDLLNDGMGNPKNTKSLLLAHQTPPAMITGIRDRAETAVRSGIRFIQFTVRPEEDAIAVDEYLKSLKPLPSPYLVDGKLSEAAERGREVFDRAQCSVCHNGPHLTDMAQYNIGTGRDREKDRTFDTPTLVEVWRTAPYLYDGRAATMKEALTTYNPNDEHGMTSDLDEQEINDLVEFVLSQ